MVCEFVVDVHFEDPVDGFVVVAGDGVGEDGGTVGEDGGGAVGGTDIPARTSRNEGNTNSCGREYFRFGHA